MHTHIIKQFIIVGCFIYCLETGLPHLKVKNYQSHTKNDLLEQNNDSKDFRIFNDFLHFQKNNAPSLLFLIHVAIYRWINHKLCYQTV